MPICKPDAKRTSQTWQSLRHKAPGNSSGVITSTKVESRTKKEPPSLNSREACHVRKVLQRLSAGPFTRRACLPRPWLACGHSSCAACCRNPCGNHHSTCRKMKHVGGEQCQKRALVGDEVVGRWLMLYNAPGRKTTRATTRATTVTIPVIQLCWGSKGEGRERGCRRWQWHWQWGGRAEGPT